MTNESPHEPPQPTADTDGHGVEPLADVLNRLVHDRGWDEHLSPPVEEPSAAVTVRSPQRGGGRHA